MAKFDQVLRSAISVDNVIFGFNRDELKVILVQRSAAPHKEKWSLPGDMVLPEENLDVAAARVLQHLVGLKDVYLEQVHTFGSVNRHPSGRVITIAYYSLIKLENNELRASSWAEQAQWHNIQDALRMPLAFDHNEILEACFNKLKKRVKTQPVGFELLPQQFTLTELQQLYEAILQVPMDKRNFRKKMLSMNILVDLRITQVGVAHRPAKLYRFDKERYEIVLEEGFTFDI
ncbi:MAG: NUDIX hydrolase [Saprospiraceae bacterium]|nr:NUDIX hydrolase [Saprospiraceae bacterium]